MLHDLSWRFRVWKASEDLVSKSDKLYHRFKLAGPTIVDADTGKVESCTIEAIAGAAVVPLWRNKLSVGVEYLFNSVRFESNVYKGERKVTVYLGCASLAEYIAPICRLLMLRCVYCLNQNASFCVRREAKSPAGC